MKPLHIGVEDFKIIKKDYYYVDKTLFLNEIIDRAISSVMLYTRPRRFGKSLMLSMVDCFFSDRENSIDYFKDTKIFSNRNDLDEYMNKVNVIHINFKTLNAKTFDDFIYSLKQYIADVYSEQLSGYNTDNLDSYLKMHIEKIVNLNGNINDLEISLSRLLTIMFKLKNKKSLLLIDEYDAPIQTAYEYNYLDDIRFFFKNFLGNALKGHNCLYKALLTGVNQVAQTSVFSDLNNLYSNNIISNQDNEYFGFNEEEVSKILYDYKYDGSLEKVKEWYGGYLFQNKHIYNPWSILCFIQNRFEFKNYWSNTGSYYYIEMSLNYLNNSNINLMNLFNGDIVITKIKETLGFDELNDVTTLYSLLAFSGYLTLKNTSISNSYIISIPNNEIKETFANEILSKYSKEDRLELLYSLKEAFLVGNEHIIGDILSKYILTCFSYYDLANEKVYQIIIVTLLSILFDSYIVKSEVNEGMGRCDIFIKSINNELAIVIEVKKLASYKTDEILSTSANAALRQISKKDYIEEAIKSNYKKIIVYGISFAGKHSKVVSKIIK